MKFCATGTTGPSEASLRHQVETLPSPYVHSVRFKHSSFPILELAGHAVRLGTAVRACAVFAEIDRGQQGKFQVFADGELVTVKKVPADLPFMEHPAYGDEPVEPLRARTQELKEHFSEAKEDELRAAEKFMTDSGATTLRVTFEGGREMTANRKAATVYGLAPHRIFPGSRKTEIERRALAI